MTPSPAPPSYRRLSLGPVALRFSPRRLAALVLLATVLLVSLIAALATGSGRAGVADVLVFFTGGQGAAPLSVVGDLRLPRVLMAILCGAMLGLAGAALQTLTRNGLADPGLLGVREGASVAVVCLMLAYPTAPLIMRPVVGMVGGFAVAILVLMIARSTSGMRFILVGIGLSWLLSAILAMILTAVEVDRIQAAMVWMAGSLSSVQTDMLPIAAASLFLGAAALTVTARAADTSLLGDAVATGLGVRLRLLRIASLAAPILLTAAAVSCVGGIGFVGLIAPHMTRFLIAGGQGSLLAGSGLLGALMVLIADTLGRTLFAPLQIPAGIVLSIIGVTLLVGLLWRRRNQL